MKTYGVSVLCRYIPIMSNAWISCNEPEPNISICNNCIARLKYMPDVVSRILGAVCDETHREKYRNPLRNLVSGIEKRKIEDGRWILIR